MHKSQFERLVVTFAPLAKELPDLQVEAVSASANAPGYAVIFMTAFHNAGMTVNGVKPDDDTSMLYPSQATVSSPEMKGLFIGVHNSNGATGWCSSLQDVAQDCRVRRQFRELAKRGENAYVFVVSYK
jgi:hypothetical protein